MLNLHCNKLQKNAITEIGTKKNAITEIRIQDDIRIHCMGSKCTQVSTTLWRPMELVDRNNQYMLKL